MELLALFSGCTLRLLQPEVFAPWLFDVFAWYRQVAERLGKRHADLVTADWLPDFPVSPSPTVHTSELSVPVPVAHFLPS